MKETSTVTTIPEKILRQLLAPLVLAVRSYNTQHG